MHHRIAAIVMLAAAAGTITATGCARDGGAVRADVVRADSAGIEIVSSPGEDIPLPWRFERVGGISSDSGGGAGAFSPNSELVRTDFAGRIYILDNDGNRILVFDDAGRLIRTSGGAGGGPGEMRFGLAFAVAQDGTAGVFDLGKRKLVRFGPGGEVMTEIDAGPDFFGGNLYMADDAVLHDFTSIDRATGKSFGGIHRFANGVDTAVVSHELPPFKEITLESCGMGFSGMPPLFTPSTRWDAYGPTLAFAADASYDIQVHENGTPVRRVRRDMPLRPATHELAVQDLGEGMKVGTDGGERVCRSDEVAEQRGFLPHVPLIGSVLVAPGGELWIRRGGIKGEELPTDVFAADGAYLGTLPSDVPFPAAFLPDNRFVAVETDENDLGHVVIYRYSFDR